jgi:hypothetical protein
MCYRFELLEFEDCLFENVDATYILHLEGNGRLDHIHDQLKTYHPSKKVYIVYNKGFKQCKKDLMEQKTNHDLVHANMTAFEHASQYKHILVLEDDFIFSSDVANHATQVDDFLKRDTLFVYQLGSQPRVAIPIDMYHYRNCGVMAHANIYSPLAREKLLKGFKENKITSIDVYIAKNLPMYMYHKPLCYQLFPLTENRINWYNGLHPILGMIITFIDTTFITCTGLDRTPELGFAIMYCLAKMIPFLLFFLLVWIYLSCTSLKRRRVR